MRKISILSCLVLFALGFLAVSKKQSVADRKPNILLIVSEDNSPHLSSYGDSVIKTPNLDKIAKVDGRWDLDRRHTKLEAIDHFWKDTKRQLALVPIDAKVEKVSEPLPFSKYKITLKSLNGVQIVGYLSIPVQGESPASPWPVIISASGYGGKQQSVMLSECQRGYAVIQVFPRGQGDSAEFYKINGDKLSGNLERPQGAYYQGAYADMMRMIDFVVTRKDLDASRIAMVGTSQGAGISLAVAAIDDRVKAVVAHVPFLCNFRLAAATPKSLVKILLDRSGKNNESSLAVLDFFDPLLLAPKITVPVIMSAGGKDTTCPAPTIQSVYDRLPGKKGIEFYPNLPHTSCQAFYNLSWPWLDQNFRNRLN